MIIFVKKAVHIRGYCERLNKSHKTYTDEEIAEQFSTALNLNSTPPKDLELKIAYEMKILAYKNDKDEKEAILDNLYKFLGWKNSKDNALFEPLDFEFWIGISSMPFIINDESNNDNIKLMFLLKKKYGARGIIEIFGNKADTFFEVSRIMSGLQYSFSTEWSAQHNLKKKKEKIYSSKYNSLDEIEDNVVIKKIKEEALNFYMDKSKDFNQRRRVFDSHGEEYSSI